MRDDGLFRLAGRFRQQDDAVLREQIRLTFGNIRFGWLGLIVLAGLVAYAAQDLARLPLWWWGLMLAAAALHGATTTLFLRRDAAGEIRNHVPWGHAMTVVSLLTGAVVSLGAIFAFDVQGPPGWGYFLAALLVMPGFGSAVTSAAFLGIHVAWVLGTGMPFSLWLLDVADPSFRVFGWGMLLVCLPVMILFGHGYRRIYQRNILLFLQNLDLLGHLEEKRRQAEQASVEKSRFLAATSHDLRQPLHALELFLGSLGERLRRPEDRELLDRARASGHALRDMLNSLLDVAQLDAGRVREVRRDVALAPLLEECCRDFRPVAQAASVDLRLRVAGDLHVHTDPLLLARIVRNLLSNAVRYTDEGGILVAARKRGDIARIEVHDTGKGIAAGEQALIFDEFYQIDNPERDRENGLGLGLAIVRRLSRLLDHPVRLRSEEGRGTCFCLSVPLGDPPSEQARELPPAGELAGMFVLVIDDHRDILAGMRELLRGWDCEVLLCRGWKEALDALADGGYPPPDVMIVDYRLCEGETGAMAIAAVREHFGTEIPAIILSGEGGEDVEQAAKRMRVELVRKPVAAGDLKALLLQKMSRLRE